MTCLDAGFLGDADIRLILGSKTAKQQQNGTDCRGFEGFDYF